MGGGQGAGVAGPAVLPLGPRLLPPAHHAPQARSYFLPQALQGALETLAEQRVQQRVDVRVQQHQPVREGDRRGRDEVGLAWDCGLCGLKQRHAYVRGPAEEKGCDDQEETHHSVIVLLGVLQGRLGGALGQEGQQAPGWRTILLCGRVRESGADVTPLLSTDLGHKPSTYMVDEPRRALRAPTVLMRGIALSQGRVWTPAALDRVLQGVDPPGVAAGHLHNVHVAEEDDHCRDGVGESSHEGGVAGTAGPVHRTAVHGRHVADGAPAQEGRATGDQSLQPDPQDHGAGPPQGAAGAVTQAVHDGVVAVEGDRS